MKKAFILILPLLLSCSPREDEKIKFNLFVANDTVEIMGLKEEYKNQKSIVIPSYIDDLPVTRIGPNAFSDLALQEVEFLNDSPLLQIGEGAFAETALQSVILPKKVHSIGMNAFFHCKNLSSITFLGQEELLFIGSCAFYENSSLTEITLPKSVKEIENEAFCNNYALETIHIYDQIEEIGAFAFNGDLKLKVFFHGIQKIPDGFSSDWNYSEVPLENGTHEISYQFE